MDYERAAGFWLEKDAGAKRMGRDALKSEAEKYILSHNTCALAAASGGFVRCTPMEYTYRDGSFWLFSEGGLKFRALSGCSSVCLAVFDSYAGFGALSGMQITGRAEMVEPWSREYLEAMAAKSIPESALRALEHPMYLIKVVPSGIDFLNSDFKKLGFDPRQHLELE